MEKACTAQRIISWFLKSSIHPLQAGEEAAMSLREQGEHLIYSST
jgi:hypothetical protein